MGNSEKYKNVQKRRTNCKRSARKRMRAMITARWARDVSASESEDMEFEIAWNMVDNSWSDTEDNLPLIRLCTRVIPPQRCASMSM